MSSISEAFLPGVPKSLPSTEVVLEDLVLEWFTLPQGAAAVGKTISELRIRTRTGASIVSIIELNRTTRTNPEAATLLNEGATLILAGDRPATRSSSTCWSRGRIMSRR